MATEQLTDQEKEFRRRARRRLIGAVALVLLMVTVLPWFLDDRGDQNMPPTDVAISIPSQDDSSFSSKIVPVAPVLPQPSSETSPASAPQATPPAAPEQSAKTSEKPVQLEAPLAPAPKEPVQKSDKAEKPGVEKPVAEKSVTEKPAVEKPVTEMPVAQKSPPKKGMVSVQIGVFSDPAKVKQVQTKIAALGLQTSTETLPTSTGPKLRMRSGPYATRAEAEQALETLKGAGFSPILVTH